MSVQEHILQLAGTLGLALGLGLGCLIIHMLERRR